MGINYRNIKQPLNIKLKKINIYIFYKTKKFLFFEQKLLNLLAF